MTRIAKIRLRFGQQELLCFRVMRRMTRNATHIVLRMDGVDRVHMLRAARVAPQTSIVDFFGRMLLKHKNLGLIPSTLYVVFAGTMAGFAPVPLRASLRIECRDIVR